ncbi:MAG TPA: hypothetical protein VIN61_15230 [Gammaproteobacteria bacterium]
MELEALERQRRSLEAERADMERERRALESLLDEAQSGGRHEAEPTVEGAGGAFHAQPLSASLTASALAGDTLDGMRGGILLGNGMNVAIGLTRTAEINGEPGADRQLVAAALTAASGRET